LTLLLEDVARKKLAVAAKPHERPSTRHPPSTHHCPGPRTRSRHIPARVKRTVWLRDDGRCGFVATNGPSMPVVHLMPLPGGGPQLSSIIGGVEDSTVLHLSSVVSA
jgi:5-methylcytosine-specific restriction endonuclease McrA